MPPKWLNPSSKTLANRQEKALATDFGLKQQPNSGSTPFRKGDFSTPLFLIEGKATDKSSISLKKEWLEKIELEAIHEGKTPLVILEIQGRRYFVFRDKDIDINENPD